MNNSGSEVPKHAHEGDKGQSFLDWYPGAGERLRSHDHVIWLIASIASWRVIRLDRFGETP